MSQTSTFWRDRPVFITGGTGLVGHFVVRALVDAGAIPTVLVRDWVPTAELIRSRLIERVNAVPGLRIRGITDPARTPQRCPTIAFTIEGQHPRDISSFLGQRGIYTWDGHYYAWELVRALGLAESGGMVRVGLVHYNTDHEIERLGAALDELVGV